MNGLAPKPWEQVKTGEGSSDDPLAVRFVESLSYDRRLYKYDIVGSLAHVRMLHQTGLINASDLDALEKGLREIEGEIDQQGESWPGWKTEYEDVHMCIEVALIDRIGEPGRKLHTGRSRNDQVVLDLKLWIRAAVKELDECFDRLFRAITSLASRDGRIVMPSYTHLQRAQPIVVGAELMAWLTALSRAQQRLGVLTTLNRDTPLGAGAIAGSALPLDRRLLAQALGLGPPSQNSIDTTSSRDPGIDFVYGLAMVAMTLSRWSEQWILYTTTEFSFITLDSRYTTGSSMMPQKQNPDMLELIRGRCGAVYGQLVTLLTICKALPLGYQRDLQEDKRAIFAAYDLVRETLQMAERIVSTTRYNAQAIERNLRDGFLDATSLAEYLVSRGVAFRRAHQIVASLVRTCQRDRRTQLADLSLDELNQACAEAGADSGGRKGSCQADVYDWLGAANVVKRYQTTGNAGVQGFEKQLADWELKLAGTADEEAPHADPDSVKRSGQGEET